MSVGYFGDIVFEVSDSSVFTFDDLKVGSSSRTEDHKIINKKPRLEYLGEELDTVSLSIKLNAGILGGSPYEFAKRLKDKKKNGVVEYLVLGDNVMGEGKWIIESISESYNTILNDGKVYSLNLDISFKEYIDDLTELVKSTGDSMNFAVQDVPSDQITTVSEEAVSGSIINNPENNVIQTENETVYLPRSQNNDIPGLMDF